MADVYEGAVALAKAELQQGQPPKDRVFYARHHTAIKWTPYRPNSQEVKRGKMGRWQELRPFGIGWQNTEVTPEAGAWVEDIINRPELATRPAPPAMDREAVDLDWRLVAKLAGEHGVRYRTNRAFKQFVTSILSTLSADAIRQGEGEEVERLQIAMTRGAIDQITNDALPNVGEVITTQSRARAQVHIADALLALSADANRLGKSLAPTTDDVRDAIHRLTELAQLESDVPAITKAMIWAYLHGKRACGNPAGMAGWKNTASRPSIPMIQAAEREGFSASAAIILWSAMHAAAPQVAVYRTTSGREADGGAEMAFGHRAPTGDQGPVAVGQETQTGQIGDAEAGKVIERPSMQREAKGVVADHQFMPHVCNCGERFCTGSELTWHQVQHHDLAPTATPASHASDGGKA